MTEKLKCNEKLHLVLKNVYEVLLLLLFTTLGLTVTSVLFEKLEWKTCSFFLLAET